MNVDDEEILPQDDDGVKAPVFVLPGAGATTAQGIGGGTGTASASPILPQPFLANTDTGTDTESLSMRIEQTLADDGRFLPLLPQLEIATNDETGRVTVLGTLQDALLRRSLLATIHAVPGVTDVIDKTT
jgi:hypothetical protein